MSATVITVEQLRLIRDRWRNLDAAATALEAAYHETAAQVRHDADRLGTSTVAVILRCLRCDQPTPVDVAVAIEVPTPPDRTVAPRLVLMVGGEPEAVLCGACNAATTAEAEAWAASLRRAGGAS
jgi:hypothetical protein